MKDILLLVAVVAFFAGGIPLMRRLDSFLCAHARPEAARPQAAGRRLRIGLADPLAADHLAGALKAFSDQRRNVSVRLFSGAEGELLQEFSEGQLDVVLLPEGQVLRRNNPPSSDASCFVECLAHSAPREPSALKSDVECDMMGARGQAGHWRSANERDDSES